MKPKLIIMVGNVGSGKSTCVKKLVKKGYVVVSKDGVRYSIGSGKYIFDMSLEKSIHKSTLTLCEGFLAVGKSVIIDETNMNKKIRKCYLRLANLYNYTKEAVIMPKLPMKESVKRRLKSNHGNTPKKVWEEVFQRKQDAYEKPTIKEGFDIIVELKNEV